MLQILFGCRALSLEILDPYFSRHGYDQIKKVEQQYQPLLLGFALPFLFLMATPLLGPLCWGLVQGAAPILLISTVGEKIVH